jgi:hypothetical protein
MHTRCSADEVPFWQKPGCPAPAQERAGIKLSRRGVWLCRALGLTCHLIPAYLCVMAAWALKRGPPLFLPMAVLAAMGCLMAIWAWDV